MKLARTTAKTGERHGFGPDEAVRLIGARVDSDARTVRGDLPWSKRDGRRIRLRARRDRRDPAAGDRRGNNATVF